MDIASRTAPHSLRSTSWRRLISALVAVAVLFSTFHHLLCVIDDASIPASARAFSSSDKSIPPVSTDRCLPMHCHCACHGTTQSSATVVALDLEFADAPFGIHDDHMSRALAAFPPFKPPRA